MNSDTEQEKPSTEASTKRAKLNSVLSIIIAGICGYAANMLWMPGNSYTGDILKLTEFESTLVSNLKGHVKKLAGEIGERNIAHYDKLELAAKYIEDKLRAYGYVPAAQHFTAYGADCRNISVELKGSKYPEQILVIGAHYDTAPGTPGADDNGSGVASSLELARTLKARHFDKTIRIVFFPNEEPPYFRSKDMGSYHCAEASKKAGEKLIGMMALETLGTYSRKAGSQAYPIRGGTLFYPNMGNFITFVSSQSSSAFNRECIGTFRRVTDFPSEGFALPDFIVGVNYSDDWSFKQFDYPAIMVTDTAPYRINTYHQATDKPETLTYDDMARVVAGLDRTVGAIAGEAKTGL